MDVRSIMQAKGRRVGNISSICTLYVTNRATASFNYAWDDVIMTIIECATLGSSDSVSVQLKSQLFNNN